MQSTKVEKFSVGKETAQNILATVPYEHGFRFFTDIGKYTGETAINLFSFYEELKTIEPQSVKFHFQRRDFQKWVETTLGDQELASRMDKTPSKLSDEELKKELLETVLGRLTELQTASSSSSKLTSPQISEKAPEKELRIELRRFNAEELKQYNGQGSKPAYLTFEGRVYDVTNSSLWQGGSHIGTHQAGQDLTEAIKSAPHDEEVLSKVKQVGVLV